MQSNPIKLINYTDLDEAQMRMVLLWRNHKKVRQMMYNKHIITLAEHLHFIGELKTRKDMQHFLVQGDEYLGVINFKDEHLGLFANPDMKGVGKILLQLIIQYGFEELKHKRLLAEVYDNNTVAIHLYKKFNFKQISKNENILTMELKNENS